MGYIAQCNNKKCDHALTCKRFLDEPDVEHYDFKNICHKNNEYEHYWEQETQIVNTEDKLESDS